MRNRAYVEYYYQGLIIGNNANTDYNYTNKADRKKKKKDEDTYGGGAVANPLLNTHTGIRLNGIPSMFIYDNVVDMDFSSMYPNIIIAFNIAPSCMVAKLVIDRSYLDIANDDDEVLDDQGKEFVDNLLIGNVANMGTRWFGLPKAEELDDMIRSKFKIRNKNVTHITLTDVDMHYMTPLTIKERHE
ncbi:DNA polymerase II [compost metagenome]